MFLCGMIFFSTYGQKPDDRRLTADGSIVSSDSLSEDAAVTGASKYDTMPLHYALRKTEFVTYDDLQNNTSPVDTKTPDNVNQSVEYDPNTGLYIFTTRVGDMDISTPFVLNEKEYDDYSLRQSMNSYWAEKNKSNTSASDGDFNLSDVKIGIGPTGDKIFGPGGVQLKTQGSVDLTFGFKISKRDNPTIPERNRTNTIFDFDTKIQLSANGKVGDRVAFTMNYNTESSFDFDQKLINLTYEGKEDDIIKRVEAGNVSLPLSTSLIQGGTALFGIRTDLQFGKLKVSALASQQESESKTINTQGAQTTDFSISAANYDENRHFFLSEYFYNNYDDWAKTLPNPRSGIVIRKIEVWVTNRSSYEKQSRNIVAFTGLGEHYGSNRSPYNDTLYNNMKSNDAIRDFQTASSELEHVYEMTSGADFENLTSARLLDASEYTLNPQMGFISLKSTLANDDILAVAYEYTNSRGEVLKVGEFSTDMVGDSTQLSGKRTLLVKLIKSTSSTPKYQHLWKLAMRNIYSLGAYNLQPDKFQVEVNYYYQDDSLSAYMNYLPELGNKKLLRVLNLDRLNKRQQAVPDGYYDFVEGYTVYASNGRIIFPSTRPFDTGLKNGYKDQDPHKVEKYTFPELYDSTLTVAKQFAEKDKFVLTGKYKSSSGSEIRLGATNVPRGSVRVTAGGRRLEEGTGFTVDYNLGTVTILDDVALEANAPISVTLESQSFFSMQRKSLVGTNLEYALSDEVTIGGTIMHLSEKPLTTKVGYGEEPMSNTIWGLNASYKTDVQWLTNLVDKIPLVNATAPSTFAISGEFAQLLPGHSDAINQGEQGVSYIDDFEGTKSTINIMHPNGWALASTPKGFARNADSYWSNYLNGQDLENIGYGLNRAHMSWFYIDQIFTNKTKSSSTPSHIFNDKEQLSNHFVRAVYEREIFQNKEALYGQPTSIQTLNLSYYPKERGPYNLDVSNMGEDGFLNNPANRWAGVMRKLDNSNFENSNVEYIEFWLMDPFVYADEMDETKQQNHLSTGGMVSGKLVFNLGDVSEDILRDGRISFENGLPTTGNQTEVDTTVWGRVPRIQAVTNSFDMSSVAQQDLGLDGLTSEEEGEFGMYAKYVQGLNAKLTRSAKERLNLELFSPFNDPAGDDFHYFRGSDYDDRELGILDRYKYYNGVEGNSSTSSGSYTTSSSTYPNSEDLNSDRTLNTKEKYYVYEVNIDQDMFREENWSKNHIASVVESDVDLRNGSSSKIKWYQVKIPVRTPDGTVGDIDDFRSIRFIRMYMTGFEEETHLRFGSLALVRTDWRVYEKNEKLRDAAVTGVAGDGTIEISSVNIENDGTRHPVNYVLPPGISREIDPSQSQIRQENEQSMSLRVDSLEPKDVRAVYKLTNLDMRQYDRLKMYVHAENKIGSTELRDNRMSIFVRLGSDFTENYYEYRMPLIITPEGATEADEIWPTENNLNVDLDLLTDLKLERDRKKTAGLARNNQRFTKMHGNNMLTVIGNPSLGEVSTMMIGIVNDDEVSHSIEVWVNELRMAGFDEEGGWAALANMGIVFSDLGSFSAGGRVETVGFGGIEQNVNERNMDDNYEYNMTAAIQLGKFFPEKAKVNFPVSYTYSKTIIKPEYDPLNSDIKLDRSLDNQPSESRKDSIRDLAYTTKTYKSLTLSNIRVGIASQTPMPYDPANFSLSLGYNETEQKDPETDYAITQNHTGSLSYVYSLKPKPVEPLRKVKLFKSNYLRIFREFNFYYLPTQLAFSTSMNRHYEEVMVRDFSGEMTRDTFFPFMTFDKDWTWDRTSDIKFNLTKSLKLSFSSSMNAEIPELIKDTAGYHNIPINKRYLSDIDKDDWYELWKDTVMSSIKHWGVPIEYDQKFTASYALPINKLPFMEWITANAQYSGQYAWDKGAILVLGEEPATGNIAVSERMWNGDVRFNMETLYNKSTYLKDINKRFSKTTRNAQKNKKDANKPRAYERKNLRLRKDSKTKIAHRLNTTKVNVVITDGDGKIYPAKYTVDDQNNISITSAEDKTGLALKVTPVVEEATIFTEIRDYTARMLMMVRNVSANYRRVEVLNLQGFRPNTGFLGQSSSAPGYDFTFGFYHTDAFLQKAYDHDWMLQDSNVVNPIVHSVTQDFQIRSMLEPITGLKIDLNGNWSKSNATNIYYMTEGRPETYGGTYSRTHIAIKTAFRSPSLNSETFADFLKNRATIQARVKQDFDNEMKKANRTYDPGRTYVNPNSSDVLVPAFLSAYSGTSASSANLDVLPNLLSLLPNWKVTYDGISRMPWFRDHFKTFNLNHAYKCQYNVNAFTSQSNWMPAAGRYGYMVGTENADFDVVASEDYIGTTNLNEAFHPLFGFDASMKNSLSLKAEYRKSRTAQLDIPGNQIVESYSNEYVFGTGYRIDDFGMIVNLNNNKQKKVKNDLNLRLDLSYKNTDAYIRKIDDAYSQLSNGLKSFIIKFSAEYVFSQQLNIRFFYDRTASTPKVSQGFPTVNTDFGLGFRFLLAR